MGRASLTIAISGTYNGKALERAQRDLERLNVVAASQVDGAASRLVSFGAAAAEMGGKLHNAGYKMQQVGDKATKSITLPIVAAGAACAAAAVQIDDALTGVKKTVDGTEAQYQALKNTAIEFSKTNAVSASQILDIQALGAQLGYARDELQEFGEVVSGLDIATNMSAEQAGTELAQFANITNMAHDRTRNYASAIVALGNTSATTESDISAMAMRIAAAGTQVGMSQADILGLAAALSSMGIEAEAGGTAISTIMSQIDKAIATNSASVKDWASAAGMSASQFADAWRTKPVDALAALLSGMESATAEGGNMSVMLDDLGISSIRQTDVLKRLAGNSELVAKSVGTANEAWEKNTALQVEVDNRNASMSARMQILANKATAVAEEVGTPLVNALLAAIDAAEPLIGAVANAADAFANMDTGSQQLILGLAGVAAGFGPVMSIAGRATQGIGNLMVTVGKGAQKLGVFSAGMKELRTMTGGQTLATLKMAATNTAGFSDALANGSKKAQLAAGAVKTLGIALKGIGIGLAVAAIGAVVNAVVKWREHNDRLLNATQGLTSAVGSAQTAYAAYSGQVEAAAKSVGQIVTATNEAIAKQSEMATQMQESWADYGKSAALVDSYVSTIEELTTKQSLNATEQEKLKLAVDGYNEATGSSISVIDAENGTLSESTQAIRDNAEAWKEHAREKAAAAAYDAIEKQRIENTMAMNDAIAALTAAREELAIAVVNHTGSEQACAMKVKAAEEAVHELEAANLALDTTERQLTGAINGSGDAAEDLGKSLSDAGLKMSDFGNLSNIQLRALQTNFDGSLTSLAKTCKAYGIKIPEGLKDGIKSKEADLIKQMASQGDMMAEAIKKELGIASPSKVMMAVGKDIDLGLKKGIDDNKSNPIGSMSTLGGLVHGALSNLPGLMQSRGRDSGLSLASGISSTSPSAYASGQTVATSGQSGAGSVSYWGTGSVAGSGFASALAAISAYTQGLTLANTGISGASSNQDGFRQSGRNAALGFSEGLTMQDVLSSVFNKAKLVAIMANKGIASAGGEGSPWRTTKQRAAYAVAGFVEGLEGGIPDVERAAEALIDASNPQAANPNSRRASGGTGHHTASQNRISAPVYNITVNVSGQNMQDPAGVGKTIGEQLYAELSRKVRYA